MPGGKRDSSKTRVAPVFDQLAVLDSTGIAWLRRLLGLPTLKNHSSQSREFEELGELQSCGWGSREKQLSPPKSLLEWLLEHAEKRQGARWGRSPKTIERRKKLLIDRDPATLEAAKDGLNRCRVSKGKWYTFEGQTQPDVFLQTPEIIVVIEGKRTEKSITTHTDWMPIRHQMLRHLDCAFETRESRQVVGFFIVEGRGAGFDIPEEWQLACAETVTPSVLRKSLPHRDDRERAVISGGFLGVTTWQSVCREFNIRFDQLPDTVTD